MVPWFSELGDSAVNLPPDLIRVVVAWDQLPQAIRLPSLRSFKPPVAMLFKVPPRKLHQHRQRLSLTPRLLPDLRSIPLQLLLNLRGEQFNFSCDGKQPRSDGLGQLAKG